MIMVDLTFVNPNKVTGVSNATFRLLSGLKNNLGSFQVYVLCNKNNFEFINRMDVGNCLKLKECKFKVLNKYLYKRQINKYLSKNIFDFFLIPFFSIWSPVPKGIKTIAVIHDTQDLTLRQGIKRNVYKILYRNCLKHLFHIVAISKFTKMQIINNYNIPSNIISVIYNSVTSCNKKYVYNSKKYILTVNALEPYKNIVTLVKAFSLIKDKCEHMLIIKSRPTSYWYKVLFPLILKEGIVDRCLLISDQYNDEDMNRLYSNADLFVTTSLMEGFGYTPIEAAIQCVPVVSTSLAALKETTLGLLFYYEPANDEKVLANLMLELINNKPCYMNLESVSNKFQKYYSVRNQVNKYYKLFKSLR